MDRKGDFEKALKFIQPIEGFVSTDPDDRGGLTIYGISSRSHKKAVLEMKKLIDGGEKDEAYKIARKIYYEVYWLKTGCDTLPFPFDMIVFDTAVNCGRSKALEFLNAYSDWRDYLLRRMEYYTNCKTARKHMWGWARRLAALYNFIKEAEKK